MRVSTSVLPLVLLACSAGSAESTSEDDYRSKPHGDDTAAGSLVVRAPAGSGVLAGRVELQSEPRGDQAFGAIFEGIPLGTAEVRAYVSEGDYTVDSRLADVPITSATLTEVMLGAVAVTAKGQPATFGLTGASYHSGEMRSDARRASFRFPTDSDGKTAIPVAAGEYHVTWGFGDGIVIPVSEAAVAKLDLWDYSQRAVTRVVPSKRELPNAECDRDAPRLRTAYGSKDIDLSGPLEIGQHPKFQTREVHARLELPCVEQEFDLPLAEVGAGPQDFVLGRLDVDHVAVKRPDGTTEKVEGSYHVMAVDGVTSIIDGWYPTNTGLDLPPGTYKLIVNYPTSAGTEGRFEETFTTP